MTATPKTTMVEEHDGYKCYRVRTAAAAKLIEGKLIEAGQSFKTKINITKKRGREFLILLLE
jgi:hypothetical protein